MELQKRVRMHEVGSLAPFLLVFVAPRVGARSSSGGRPQLWRGRGSALEVQVHERESREKRGYRGRGARRPRSLFPDRIEKLLEMLQWHLHIRSRLRALLETA
jgi:hypothetical protein